MLEDRDAAELTDDFAFLDFEEQRACEMMEGAMTSALAKVATQLFKKE